MPLDAFVYCDCFERENLRSDPPQGIVLKQEENGDVSCKSPDEKAWSAFVRWKQNKACMHPGMVLVHKRLGSTELVEALRTQLQKERARFPILLEKVLYSDTHTCDWIPFTQIEPLENEVAAINPEGADPEETDRVRLFKIQMAELIIAAKHTGKAICF